MASFDPSTKAFKRLITDLCSELNSKEVRKIAYQHDMHSEGALTEPLNFFCKLQKEGIIGPRNLSVLKEDLETIRRIDLASKVKKMIEEQESVSPKKDVFTHNKPTQCFQELSDINAHATFTNSTSFEGILPKTQLELHQATSRNEFEHAPEDRRRHFSETATTLSHRAAALQKLNLVKRHHSDASTFSRPSMHNYIRKRTHSPSASSAASSLSVHSQYIEERTLMGKMLDLMITRSTQTGSTQDMNISIGKENPTDTIPSSVYMHSEDSDKGSETTLTHSKHHSPNDPLQEASVSGKTNKGSGAGIKFFTWKPKSRAPRASTMSSSTCNKQNVLHWPVKRDSLNKPIFRHQADHIIECKKKIEVDAGNNHLNPKLTLVLHPYGLEDDKQLYVTLEVLIEVPKKAPKLRRATSVKLSITIKEGDYDGKKIGEITMTENLDLRVFYKSQFISHEELRNSKCDIVEITACAECILPGTV